MTESKSKHIKRYFKIGLRFIAILLLLQVVLVFAFSFPKVQTYFAKKVSSYINKTYDTDIHIKRLALNYKGNVSLKGLIAKDKKSDTILNINKLETSLLSFNKLRNGKTQLGKVLLKGVNLKIQTYAGDSISEFNKLIDRFDKNSDKKSTKKSFLLTSKNIILEDAQISTADFNKKQTALAAFYHVNGQLENFKIAGSDVSANIRQMNFIYENGLSVKNLDTDFKYSNTGMQFENMLLQTEKSELTADVNMQYEVEDLKDFNEKVIIEANIKKAQVTTSDLTHFYDQFGEYETLYFSSKLKGTLNDFRANNLKLRTANNLRVNGDFNFRNVINPEEGFAINTQLHNLEANYKSLQSLIPSIVTKNIPEAFKDLGEISLNGNTSLSNHQITTDINATTAIGQLKTKMKLVDFDNSAHTRFSGDISMTDFDLGHMLKDSLLGKITITADISGKSFDFIKSQTNVKGHIKKVEFKDYTYRNIDLQGSLSKGLFSGNLVADDPNAKLNFKGLADFSKEFYDLDFTADIEHINFKELNLFTRDSLSVLKGNIKMDMKGNRLENMNGTLHFTNTTYKNPVKEYHFKDFTIASKVQDSIQSLSINSTDIIEGRLKGKFIFKELGKLTQNALGSIYTNYEPYKVSPNQHLDFNFKIYNQIIAIFFPEVSFGTNTRIKGTIDSDKNLFRLNFKSPEALVFDNYLEKIRLQVDNKNPLFNTQVSIKDIKTKYYDINSFELVNITLNDTLFFRSEFKGGERLKDKYDLSFYHTIDENKQSIVNFQKSSIRINNSNWVLNPHSSKNNITYNPETGAISYDDFILKSGNQTLSFYGKQTDKDTQNYNIDLDRIMLSEIIPDLEDFDFEGMVNGGIWLEKRNGMLIPTADVQVLDLFVNKEKQGDLIGEIKGTETNKKYEVNLYLEKEAFNLLETKGNLDFSKDKPTISLAIDFNNYPIGILNAIGKDVMKDIRGYVNGDAKVTGLLKNPELQGNLYLNDAGIFFPYINVDYRIEDQTIVRLNNNTFEIQPTQIFDSLFETSGTLSGSLSHNAFKKWYLDLAIDTDNLLAINTPEKENSLFYGTGYLNGEASFKGYTENIDITINGSSMPGTEIIIPMNDTKTLESSKFIQFKEPKEKEEKPILTLQQELNEKFKGLTMNFNFDITKDALIEIIIDKASGSLLRGNGTGNILMEIDTKGTFNMYGDYLVDKGFYVFKYGGIINKAFEVEKGGSITFNGDPYKAALDIEAVYSTKANPQVLLTESGVNRRIKVDLITKLTGELFNSKQKFDIQIPNADIDLSSELDFILNDNDTGNLMTQFVSLLATGSFYNSNNDINYTGTTIGNEGLNTITSAVANALLKILTDPSDKIQFGVDYLQGNKIINTEDQLGVSLATRLGKNEKIIINGEVNVPTGSQSNANIAGNVSAEVPMNKKENLMLRVFNRQNEIQYTDETQGYTQGIGLSWQVNFDSVKDLFYRMGFGNKYVEPIPEKEKDSLKNKKASKSF